MNWPFISFFGDSTVILPSVLVTLVILLWQPTTRIIALQWGIVFGLTGFVVSLSKLAFMGWGLGIPQLNFTGFSGHSALSTVFWPIFLWLITASLIQRVRIAAIVLGYAIAMTIGYSRLMVNAHSLSEVVTGLALGLIASSLFFMLQSERKTSNHTLAKRKSFLLIGLLPLCLLNTGVKAPTQSLLGKLAVEIGPFDQVYTRLDMLKAFNHLR